jgi:hypothetical protein
MLSPGLPEFEHSFHHLGSLQYVIQGPARTTRYNLPPCIIKDSILRAQEVPIGTMFRFQPLKIVNPVPEVVKLGSLGDLVLL